MVDKRGGYDPAEKPTGVRTNLLFIYELGRFALIFGPAGKKVDNMAFFMKYAMEHPSCKKRTLMDIPNMVERWNEAIIGLTLSHDRSGLDRWEHVIDDLLTPLLSAPVKQLRQFYHALTTAIEADKRVPFFIHRMFRTWGKEMLDKAPDEGVIQLKTKLAEEITRLVEKDVLPQVPDAIIAALQWRPAETLEKVKKALEGGKKAKLVGKESCLFIEVDGEVIQL